MIDAYTIGITLALNNGVSDGIAAIRRDLEALDRAVDASAAGLNHLRQAADAAVAGVTADIARLIDATRRAASTLPRPQPESTSSAQPSSEPSRPAPAAHEPAPSPPAPARLPSESPEGERAPRVSPAPPSAETAPSWRRLELAPKPAEPVWPSRVVPGHEAPPSVPTAPSRPPASPPEETTPLSAAPAQAPEPAPTPPPKRDLPRTDHVPTAAPQLQSHAAARVVDRIDYAALAQALSPPAANTPEPSMASFQQAAEPVARTSPTFATHRQFRDFAFRRQR